MLLLHLKILCTPSFLSFPVFIYFSLLPIGSFCTCLVTDSHWNVNLCMLWPNLVRQLTFCIMWNKKAAMVTSSWLQKHDTVFLLTFEWLHIVFPRGSCGDLSAATFQHFYNLLKECGCTKGAGVASLYGTKPLLRLTHCHGASVLGFSNTDEVRLQG